MCRKVQPPESALSHKVSYSACWAACSSSASCVCVIAHANGGSRGPRKDRPVLLTVLASYIIERGGGGGGGGGLKTHKSPSDLYPVGPVGPSGDHGTLRWRAL